MPCESLNGKIEAFTSTNGGASWTGVSVSSIRFHPVDGDLRTSPLPRLILQAISMSPGDDCRYRQHCSSNDIVFSTSTDGVTWSDTARFPIDPVTSTVDHFIPGLAV